jgi:hypothetical protein
MYALESLTELPPLPKRERETRSRSLLPFSLFFLGERRAGEMKA